MTSSAVEDADDIGRPAAAEALPVPLWTGDLAVGGLRLLGVQVYGPVAEGDALADLCCVRRAIGADEEGSVVSLTTALTLSMPPLGVLTPWVCVPLPAST